MFTNFERKILIILIPTWIIFLTIGTIIWCFYFRLESDNRLQITDNNGDQWLITSDQKKTKEELKPAPIISKYIEITEGCEITKNENCVKAFEEPNASSTVMYELRKGTVLKISKEIKSKNDKDIWYEIIFDEFLRYPERVNNPWYINASGTKTHLIEEPISIEQATSSKKIIIKRSEQKLYAYDENNELFMEQDISTGLANTPTPRGNFKVFRKTPSRYMQGPIPGISAQYFDLPGVPWDLYFTEQGAVIQA
jgi:hypothetical protein